MTSIDQSETGPLKTTSLRARQHQTPQKILIDNLELSYQAANTFTEQNTTKTRERYYFTKSLSGLIYGAGKK